MNGPLCYRGRTISAEDLASIRQIIAQNPRASRRKLSVLVGQAWDWRQANGAWRDMVCRGLMLMLHRAGHIELPPKRQAPANPLAQRARPATDFLVDQSPMPGPLPALLRPVACLAWSSGPWHMGPRDRFIGWTPPVRRQHLHLLAYNTRFLILPWGKVPHLASHLLGRIARAISADWQQLYGHPVHYLETFVDQERFKGTCYRAANGVVLGQTTGRGIKEKTRKVTRSFKDVLGYPRSQDFRAKLGARQDA